MWWVYSSNVTGTSLPGLRCGLRPPKFEHRNGADSSGLACVLGKAWVAPRLLRVDAVAFSTAQFADGHRVCLGSAFDTAVTGGGQVVVPVPVGGYSALGCEDVDECLARCRAGGTPSGLRTPARFCARGGAPRPAERLRSTRQLARNSAMVFAFQSLMSNACFHEAAARSAAPRRADRNWPALSSAAAASSRIG